MSLEDYLTKRNFTRTPEPIGIVEPNEWRRFVIQEHRARSLHWDLRLEHDGVLKSWAVPKGPPEESSVRRLAVETEDHPIAYLNFEDRIPDGEYGAGIVRIWDRGEYELEKWQNGEVIVHLKGSRLVGRYCLIRMKGQNGKWLLFRCVKYEREG